MCVTHTLVYYARVSFCLETGTRLLYSNEIVSIVSLTPDGVSGQYHSVALVTPGTLYSYVYLVAVSVGHMYWWKPR